ncbi:MAG TPA: alpha/beta fold hydrolase [Dehalococcoidia bacterium]
MDAPPVRYARTSDGYDIAYTDSGHGVPFVWVAGPITHARLDWESPKGSALEQLAQRFRLITYDARGHGLSTRTLRAGYVMSDDETDLEAVIAATGIDRFILFGQFYFGHVAMRYAVRNLSRVRALILFNSRVGGQAARRRSIPVVMASENWELFVETMARFFPQIDDREAAKQRIRASVSQDAWLMRSVPTDDSDIRDIAGLVDIPVLVLATIGPTSVEREEPGRDLAALLPDSQLVVITHPDGGLNSDEPGPKPAIQAIDDFVATLPAEEAPAIAPAGSFSPAIAGLSRREVEVLRLVAAGRSNQQIADELVISLNTVRRHVSNVFDKTGAINRAQAAVYAKEHRLA